MPKQPAIKLYNNPVEGKFTSQIGTSKEYRDKRARENRIRGLSDANRRKEINKLSKELTPIMKFINNPENEDQC